MRTAINEILVPEHILRKTERNDKTWPGFVDSIKRHGQIQPIQYRIGKQGEMLSVYTGTEEIKGKSVPKYETINVEGKRILVNGMQRMGALTEIGVDTVDAVEIETDVHDAEYKSVVANIQQITTKPGYLSKQIRKWILVDGKSIADISRDIAKSADYVMKLVSLNKIPELADLIDSGKITLLNAMSLVKNKGRIGDAMPRFIDEAQVKSAGDLMASIANYVSVMAVTKQTVGEIESEECPPLTPVFSRDRLDGIKARYDQLRESAGLDGEEIGDCDMEIIKLLDEIFQVSKEDQEKHKNEWQEKQAKRIEAARKRK